MPPQLATLRDHVLFKGHWLYEIKLDGYRMQAMRRDGTPHVISRNGLDWTDRFSFP